MRFETFAFLPPLSPTQIEAQAAYMLKQGLVPAVEHTENPSHADIYWRQWPIMPAKINSTTNQPEPLTPSHLLNQLEACARRHPYAFIKLSGYCPRSRMVTVSFVARTPQEGQ